jgi:methionyl aminopeptidase
MITIKTDKEIKILREGGRRLARVLRMVAKEVRPGISPKELDQLAEKLIREGGDEPAFLLYKPEGAKTPYPATLCVSINNEIVHGIPKKNVTLKEGDIVSLDCGIKHGGLYTDSAITVGVGKIPKAAVLLLQRTHESLMAGIEMARAGNTVGDIGHAVEQSIKPHKYGIVRELSGHGVGHKIHEDPYVPNFGKPGSGAVLKAGMVIAIEPMINEGGKAVVFDEDGYTIRTADGSRSAHFEHTIAITDGAPIILTEV